MNAPVATTAAVSKPTNDEIAALARRIWEEEAKPEGRAEIHWQLAEAELLALQDDSQQNGSLEAGLI